MFMSSFSSIASVPSIKTETPTLIYTMWDLRTGVSYLLDTQVQVKSLIEKPKSFEIDVLGHINDVTDMKVESLEIVRWGVVGGSYDIGGYVAGYKKGQIPQYSNISDIGHRISRLGTYYHAGDYNGDSFSVSEREEEHRGHYIKLWQGNFLGMSPNTLEAKMGKDYLNLWSVIAVAPNQIEKKMIGKLILDESGILTFEPD